MAKKAKFSVNGYFKYLMGWFKLMKRREALIASGDPSKIDISDYPMELSKQLHPGRVKAYIAAVKEETPTTRTFTLKAAEGYHMPFFYAGQYISVKFLINGKWVTRPFSISSAPMEADREGILQITLRKKPGGYVTDYVWNNWKEGVEVQFDGGFGDNYWSSIRDAEHVVACDYVGVESANKVPDKFERAGFHATKSEFVNAPLIDELPMALECTVKSYDPESHCLIGKILNVCADEKVLNEEGKIDPAKLRPITYDAANHKYVVLGEAVGTAFCDGNKLK